MSAQPLEETVPHRRDPAGRPGAAGPADPAGHAHGDPSPGGSARDDVGSGVDVASEPQPVEVRRNAAVSAVVGAAASAVAIAYLWRAVGTGAALDWGLFGLMAMTAGVFLRGLLDARLPLLVADELGVRIRLGAQWRGLPWDAVDRVAVRPRRGVLRDGRMVVTLRDVQRAVEGLDGRARRHARLNQRMYGAPLAVPLGLTTRVPGGDAGDLTDRVAALSSGRAEVVTLLAEPGAVLKAQEAAARPADDLGTPEPGLAHHATLVPEKSGPVPDPTPVAEPAEHTLVLGSAEPERSVTRSLSLRGARVRSIAKLGEPVAPLVIDDFQPEPAYDPVIGPELAAARTRVGLSVDELADRTRIRPHVIESIEVDDFTPCGGDFYARGHIRTLARVLGKDPGPMLAQFEQRYATAPVNARKVFEAELATGLTGTVRSTVGGPNWTLLVGAVLTLVLVWSAVRLLDPGPEEVLEPAPLVTQSAHERSGYAEPRTHHAPPPVVTRLSAVNAGTHVEVRDGDGSLVYEGDLVIGQVRTVRVDPPVTVTSDNAGALTVAVNGQDEGVLGELDQPATRVFQRPES